MFLRLRTGQLCQVVVPTSALITSWRTSDNGGPPGQEPGVKILNLEEHIEKRHSEHLLLATRFKWKCQRHVRFGQRAKLPNCVILCCNDKAEL